MVRIIPFLLYLWLVALHQVVLGEATAIYGVTINLPVLVVLLVGLYKSELDSCWFGFMVGLVAFAGLTSLLGWHALVLAAIGYFAFHSRSLMNLESVYSRVLLIFGGVLVHNTVVLLMSGGDGVVLLFFSKALTGAVYTSVIAWVFFLFKEGKVTLQKFRAIF